MANSTHKCEVVKIEMEKHQNSDNLSIMRPFGGYTVVLRTEDWLNTPLGIYIPPDNVVDVRRPEFSFLAAQAKSDMTYRVRAKKLRGVVSFGLLVPAPEGLKEGDDATELLGVKHYVPGQASGNKDKLFVGGECASAPNIYFVKYDLETLRRYKGYFKEAEMVVVHEKLDGCNSRYVYSDGKMHCGSHYEWKKEFPDYSHVTLSGLLEKGVEEERAKAIIEKLNSSTKRKNLWWEMLERTPTLEKFCRDNPDTIVYGECFGTIGKIKYGLPEGNRFAAFDIMKDGRWLNHDEAMELAGRGQLPWAPPLSMRPFDFDELVKYSEGNTHVMNAAPKTIREGCVVKPMVERVEHCGRLCMKLVSAAYLEKDYVGDELNDADEL